MTHRLPREVSASVAAELDARADPETKAWWTRYLKGEARFRGVKMAGIRAVAGATNEKFALDDVPVDRLFDVTDGLFAQPVSEDKLCATLILAEHQLERLRTIDTRRLAGPLEHDLLADWNSCDWYCVKVLGPFIATEDIERRARAIARWRHAPLLWQRRAAAVAFVNLVSKPPLFDGLHELVVEVCEHNVADPTRWSQTSVGWVMRELAKQSPTTVDDFVSAHRMMMSNEAVRAATRNL